MKRLSITVRLTLLFILVLSVAGAGIVWTLYNGLASELKWRDDTTLINRTAQIKQLLIDGVNPDTLPVYFNRMMDVSQDILIIHGDSINKIVNRTNVSDDMLNNIPATETISAAGIYRSIINDTEIDALRIKEGANKRGNSSRLTQSFHFFMFEPIFSPVNALNQPI